ncbi:PTS sugar transporter subunit IIC [Enterococcus faecium]|uniref:PTS sugar transporter subunit IIC n=1 Tax=Enterococcus faecium TaxID=1352 RepID=UPI00156034CB|nr:PTS transporter subunit EIIC [Enterococcus faecium]NRE67992.1 PTS sugar transporter subunit IIC [Enterococcus faecium]NTK80798.1 PTS sugar transporter subunit IIC [Enterococcus faecium]NTK94964.1 PTS sugar transporter subunit IIC [Enterococcus faecium]NTL15430.1 PTS sugar transporter subunit IIC [Enterococcus faecium]NTM39260.1 PTS sugar transporter subunit IIC [Enterococcus faecium]
MDKFVAFMEKHFIPVASKIGAQRHLVAIRDSFMVSMPLMILGALAVMINNLPIPGFQELMNSIFGGESWKGFGAAAWNGTFAILSVLIAFLLAYHLANGYRKDGVSAGVISLGSFFALGGALGMSSNGLFIAIIVGIISTEIFVRLSGNEKLIIKMPDGVPPAVAKAFASLLPAMITISAFALVAAIFAAFGVDDIVGSFYTVVQEPFMGLANSYPSALLLAFITPFLWFFGLLLAIYLVGRKNKPYMVVTNLSIAPGVFNINEPTMFGLPIVLNPIMFIPFILTPMVLVSVAYFATSTGLVPAATVMPPWVTPPIIGGVLATKSIAGGVLAAVNLVLSILIYLPFVKVATIQERRKEALDA